MIGTDHRRHVDVGLTPKHALGPTGGAARADHEQIIRRRGHVLVGIPLRQRILQGHRAGQFRNRTAVVDRQQQVGTVRREHIGELRAERLVIDDCAWPYVVEQFLDFARRVVVVDVHRDGAGLEATDDHVGVEVVVHDERNAVLSAFPIL